MALQTRNRLLWTVCRTLSAETQKTSLFPTTQQNVSLLLGTLRLQADYHGSRVPQNLGSISVLSIGQRNRVLKQDDQKDFSTWTTKNLVCCIPVRHLSSLPHAGLSRWPRPSPSPVGQAAGWFALPWAAGSVATGMHVKCVRYKSGGRKSKRSAGSSSDEEDSDLEELGEEDYEAPLQFRKMTIHVKSLRADSVVSSALDISRNRVDELFYASRLRLNGEKLLKKSKQMEEGDYADLIVERSVDDDEGKMLVKRVKVMAVSSEKTAKDKNLVTVRVWKAPFPIQNTAKGDWAQE